MTDVDLVAENARLQENLDAVGEALARHPRACDRHEDRDAISCGWKSAVADVEHAVRTGLGRDVPTASREELERFVQASQSDLWGLVSVASRSEGLPLDESVMVRLVDVVAWFGPLPEERVDPRLVSSGVYAAVIDAAGRTVADPLVRREPGRNDIDLIALAKECAR